MKIVLNQNLIIMQMQAFSGLVQCVTRWAIIYEPTKLLCACLNALSKSLDQQQQNANNQNNLVGEACVCNAYISVWQQNLVALLCVIFVINLHAFVEKKDGDYVRGKHSIEIYLTKYVVFCFTHFSCSVLFNKALCKIHVSGLVSSFS